MCEECRTKSRARWKARKERLNNAGICDRCAKQPALPGRRWCSDCKEKYGKCFKKYRCKLKADGLCTRCGNQTDGKANCQECRRKENASRFAARLMAIKHYGGRCACPKCPDPECSFVFLCIDHVDNNGAEHRKEIGSGIYEWLRKNNYPDGFQVLCYNCNMGKSINGGVCPHIDPKCELALISINS